VFRGKVTASFSIVLQKLDLDGNTQEYPPGCVISQPLSVSAYENFEISVISRSVEDIK
jgi:hypothetical protein